MPIESLESSVTPRRILSVTALAVAQATAGGRAGALQQW